MSALATKIERILYDLVARDSASRTFERAGRSAEGAESRFAKFGKAVAVAGAATATAAVAIGVETVKMATNFQAAMTKIQTQAGASAADVKTLSNQVLELGSKRAQQSPTELADALYHLKSIGLDNVAAMKALRTASDFAAVGGANLEETTSAIGAAWRSGIKGARNFGSAAATLNAIIGAGNMRMQDLIDAMGTGFLATSRTFGVSLKSIGAALATLTDEGIPANVAATRLRMSISLLAAPSDHAIEYLKVLGLKSTTLADDMRSPGGIVTAIADLKDHLDKSGLSASKQAILLSHAFGGGRSSSAILTLLNNLNVLNIKQKQINDTTSRYGQAVIAQRKTAEAQYARLRAIVEATGVRIGLALLPPLTKFVSWINTRAIPAVSKFTHWLTSPDVKPWAEIAGKITASALAASAIYGAFHKVRELPWLKDLLSIGKTAAGRPAVAVAGANMSAAAKVMLEASLNMLKAAGIEADTAGAGLGGKSGAGGAGAAGPAAAGAAAARGGVVAGARSFLRTAAMAALITEIVVKPILSSIPQDRKAGTTFWDRPFGGGPKGSSGWESWHQLAENLALAGGQLRKVNPVMVKTRNGLEQVTPAVARFGLSAGQVVKPVKEAAKAFKQVPSHFAPGPGITVGTPKVPSHFAAKPGSGVIVPTKAEQADLKWLERLYGVSLPRAEKLASASGSALGTKWDSQSQSAANARTRLAALSAAYMLMHGGQKRATADAEAYTTALRLNGAASVQTISARRQYIRDLEAAHVPAKDAVRLASQLATGINTLGSNLSTTHPSRKQLTADLVASGVSARTARGLVDRYATAVKTDGANSDRAAGARRRLINDLEKSGLTAKAAARLVDGLQTRISNLKGKTVNVGVHGSGSGNITFSQQVLGQNKKGYLEFHSRGALIPGYGGGDKHLAMLEGGETVVPKHLTPLIAPLMKAHRIRGFSQGGLVGNASVLSKGVPYAVSTGASFARQSEQYFAQAAARATKSALNQAAKAFAGGGGKGVSQWAGTVGQVLRMLGQPASAAGIVLSQMATESGGNPSVVNKWDSNWLAGTPSAGLMQVIGPTFAAYAGPFRRTGPFAYGVSLNPMANIYAGLNYAIHRYGAKGWMGVLGHGHGYRTGTRSAMPGWAKVGERGEEWVNFRGGESVLPHGQQPPTMRQGPLIHADQLIVNNGTDLALLGQKLNFAAISSGFRM